MRLALIIEYEGTLYKGFQLQSNGPSIQGELETALERLSGEKIRIKGAGRTDAGVHALGQVVAFDTNSRLESETFVRGLNFYLPEDIAVKAAYQMPPSFDPRHNAVSRKYRYTILNSESPSPLLRRFVYLMPRPLDTKVMNEAAMALEGKRDCAPFSGLSNRKNMKTVREIFSSRVVRMEMKVIFEITANAFLPQQVRRTIGALLDVGLGKMSLDEFLNLSQCGVLGAATQVVPPNGLCLVEVAYRDFPPSLES